MQRLTQTNYEYADCEFMESGMAEYMNKLAAYEDTGLEPAELYQQSAIISLQKIELESKDKQLAELKAEEAELANELINVREEAMINGCALSFACQQILSNCEEYDKFHDLMNGFIEKAKPVFQNDDFIHELMQKAGFRSNKELLEEKDEQITILKRALELACDAVITQDIDGKNYYGAVREFLKKIGDASIGVESGDIKRYLLDKVKAEVKGNGKL